MALIFAEGFDGMANADLPGRVTYGGHPSGAELTIVTGRNGGNAARCHSNVNSWMYVTFPGVSTQLTAGLVLRFVPGALQGNRYVLNFADGASSVCKLILDTEWTVRDSTNTYLGRTSIGPLNNFGTYMEVQITLGNPGSIEIRFDGAPVFSGAGNFSGTINYMEVGVSGDPNGHETLVDDWYILDDQGAHCNDFLGDVRIVELLPTSDGDLSEWTPSTGSPHYPLVDDPTPNGDTDYVSSGTPGQRDLYGAGPAIIGVMYAVQVVITSKTESGGTNQMRALTKVSGTVYESADIEVPGSYLPRVAIFETNPATGLPWTGTQVSGSQWGVKLQS